MTAHSVVFVAWQCSETRRIMPVGRLLRLDEHQYEFAYIRAVRRAQERGFGPFVAFPDLDRVYRSDGLPALFQNRVMPSSRPDFPAFVSQLALPNDSGPLELLARSGGRRATDELEIFAPPTHTAQGTVEMFVLARAVRHIPHAEEAISALKPADRILVLNDRQNPYGRHVLMLRTASDAHLVGYLPDYLALELQAHPPELSDGLEVIVERVNPAPAPVHHRLLCRVQLPPHSALFQGEDYAPLSDHATPVAA